MRKSALLIFICLSLSACMVGPDFHTPPAPKTKTYTEAPQPTHTLDNSQQFILGRDISGEWWSLFQSPELNKLIQCGLTNSPNVQAAQAALLQAQESLRAQVGSALFPQVTGQLSAERQKASANSALPGQPKIFNLFNASVNVSYALDVVGGARRELEALRAQVDFQQFELEAAYLTLTANIVTTAITSASLQAQVQATQELIQSQTRQLAIVKKQFKLGAASGADVYLQQSQLATTQATLPPLVQRLAQARHALAVLVGEFPGDSQIPDFTLDKLTLPRELPLSLPSSLVQQRPDIRAKQALLAAASAQVGVATANLYPNITLSGSYGGASSTPAQVFSAADKLWSLGGQLMQPIFNAGSLRAKRRAAIAAYEQAYAQYRETVLEAFQNVADTLRALENDATALQAQQAAENAARHSLALTEKQFKLGGVSYLSLLTAQRQYQQTRINRIQAQAARYNDSAALFQALGGGWWHRSSNA